MVFSSFLFLFCFLPVTILGYFLFPRRFGNLFLLLMSYLFYFWGAPTIIPFLFGMSLFDYLLSSYLAPERKSSQREKQLVLTLGIVGNLSLLFYFKYWNFFLEQYNTLFSEIGFQEIHWQKILLPIGISFFTFQKISYLVDVYRGTAKKAQSFIHYALYVALFPQLIAGPIVRYHEIAEQFRSRSTSWENISRGATRFSFGLAKKVLIADFLGQSVDQIFALGVGELTTPYAWVGILAYTFQIYFDFSGYSDMAIGIGYIFGFTLPENFRQPYLATSFRDFWSRWHMTLSHWMKEYLYIPLGGNRGSHLRTAINLWTVFLLSGLWHGASWNFILWGAFHGLFLSGERFLGFEKNGVIGKFSPLVIFPLLVLSWVLFRSSDLGHAITYYTYLFGLQSTGLLKPIVWGELLQNREWIMLFLAMLLSVSPLAFAEKKHFHVATYLTRPISYGLLLLSFAALAGIDYAPFLYFRF